MHPTPSDIGFTLLLAALVLFVIYRRFRRNFGRQPVRPKRMIVRIVLLAVICVLALASPFHGFEGDAAATIGAVVGIALGFWALAHTRFETTAEGRFYTPNGYIGMIVVALFIGRLIYRFIVIYPLMHAAAREAAQNPQLQSSPLGAYERNPLTLGLFFLLAGYYICYYVSVLMKSRSVQPVQDDNKPRVID
ncbi:MAG: DUF1453 domain-containing protein [Gammaproteobacteria bacterium]